jgi:hypothetical protein
MSATGIVANVKQSAKTIGTELPAAIAEQVAAAEDFIARADAITGSRQLLLDAVLDAIAAGKDYHADKVINRLLLDYVLASENIGNAARERADRDIAAVLVACSDDILTAWADALEPHSVALAEAAAALPDGELNDVQATIKGRENLYHVANAQHAVKLWHAAVSGFQQIALSARISLSNKTLILTRDDAAADNLQADPWLLARHGIGLSLPTLGEYAERVAAHEQQQQRVAAAATA